LAGASKARLPGFSPALECGSLLPLSPRASVLALVHQGFHNPASKLA